MEYIQNNIKQFKIVYKQIFSLIISAFAIIFYFFNIDDFIVIINKYFNTNKTFFLKCLLFVIFVIVVIIISFIITFIFIISKKHQVIIKDKLITEYGDIFRIKSKKKVVVVIPFNTAFDVIIDEDLTKAEPLVSANTIHGQFIKLYEKQKTNTDLNKLIQENLNSLRYEPVKVVKKERGNSAVYPIGTIATIEFNNICYYLLAISNFNNKNVACSSKEDIITSMISLIKKHNENGQGYDLYIPLFGTGLSRSNIKNKYEALKTLISVISLYENELIGKVHIVIYEKEKNNIPLC